MRKLHDLYGDVFRIGATDDLAWLQMLTQSPSRALLPVSQARTSSPSATPQQYRPSPGPRGSRRELVSTRVRHTSVRPRLPNVALTRVCRLGRRHAPRPQPPPSRDPRHRRAPPAAARVESRLGAERAARVRACPRAAGAAPREEAGRAGAGGRGSGSGEVVWLVWVRLHVGHGVSSSRCTIRASSEADEGAPADSPGLVAGRSSCARETRTTFGRCSRRGWRECSIRLRLQPSSLSSKMPTGRSPG